MTLNRKQTAQGKRVVWMIVLVASVLMNIIFLACRGSSGPRKEDGKYLESLTEGVMQRCKILQIYLEIEK